MSYFTHRSSPTQLVLAQLTPASHNKHAVHWVHFFFFFFYSDDFWVRWVFVLDSTFWSLADLSTLIFCLQVSDDDSYISDVSDSVSMDTYSNEGGSERHNSGT